MRKRFYLTATLLPFLFAVTFLFSSCDKERSLERGPNAGISSGTSVYTYVGAQANCSTPIINGAYFVNTAVTAVNTIQLQVNVTTIGTYKITSSTTNGISFLAAGTAVTTGLQTIIFTATGTPLAKGNFTYIPGYNGCSFSITVNDAIVTNNATFTFPLAPNACANDSITGTYMVGMAMAVTNTVKMPVNVTVAGAYNISTVAVNGVSFTGSGTFTTIGVQSIILTGAGIPLLAGPFNYSPGSNGCSFLITVVPAAPPAVFTFPLAPNTCNPVVVKGSFVAGTAVTASNTVTLQVNVTTVGAYNITTLTVNGISFSSAGIFTTLGAQSIILTGVGTPLLTGNFNYSPGSNGCAFSITVLLVAPPAIFTLGNCSDLVVNGTYITAQPVTNDNSINVIVTVTTAGTFSLLTTVSNGISFGGSGTFPSAGMYNINLHANGTPTAAGTNPYTFQSPNDGCSFNVVVTDVAPIISGTLSCKIDNVLTTFNDRSYAGNTDINTDANIWVQGYQLPPNGQSIPQFTFSVAKNDKTSVTTGAYNEHSAIPTSMSNLGYKISISYDFINTDGTTTLFLTGSDFPNMTPPYALTNNPPFIITITSISATHVKGTFSGKLMNALEGNTITKVITEGAFDEPIK